MSYSSKYYDPEKAHEYYMRTRELKGYENRYGGSRGDGTSAASSGRTFSKDSSDISSHNSAIDKQIRAEKNNNVSTKDLQKQIRDNKNNIQRSIDDINGKIKELRAEYSGLSKEDKKNRKYEIEDTIDDYKQQIKSLRREQQDTKDSIRDQIHKLKLSQKDRIQELKMQKKGGSTAGFNQKGMEAAEYIKEQMNKERDEVISKTNKDLDNSMLDKVRKFSDYVKNLRSKGVHYDNKKLLSELRKFTKEAKKKKNGARKKHISEYIQKYKDEIDKLRQDKSMYTYYDNRAESENIYEEQKKYETSRKQQIREYQDAVDEVKREYKIQKRNAENLDQFYGTLSEKAYLGPNVWSAKVDNISSKAYAYREKFDRITKGARDLKIQNFANVYRDEIRQKMKSK